MRILYVTDTLRAGGVENRLLTMASQSRTEGHAIKIVSLAEHVELEHLLGALASDTIYLLPSYRLRKDLFALRNGLTRVVNEFSPDIIQVFNFVPLLVSSLCPCSSVVFGISNCGYPHWFERSLRARFVSLLERRALSKNNAWFIACSQDARSAWLERYPKLDERLWVVPNGVELRRYTATIGPPRSQPVIQWCGSLSATKRPDLALSALAALRDKGVRAFLRIAGDGPMRSTLRDHADELGISQFVEFQGVCRNMPSLLADADVLWNTSDCEGFGLVVVEAMLSGTPVVVRDVPGVRLTVRHGDTGLVVSGANPERFAVATMALIRDKGFYQDMAQRALSRAQRFSAERMGERYRDIYRTIMKRREK